MAQPLWNMRIRTELNFTGFWWLCGWGHLSCSAWWTAKRCAMISGRGARIAPALGTPGPICAARCGSSSKIMRRELLTLSGCRLIPVSRWHWRMASRDGTGWETRALTIGPNRVLLSMPFLQKWRFACSGYTRLSSALEGGWHALRSWSLHQGPETARPSATMAASALATRARLRLEALRTASFRMERALLAAIVEAGQPRRLVSTLGYARPIGGPPFTFRTVQQSPGGPLCVRSAELAECFLPTQVASRSHAKGPQRR